MKEYTSISEAILDLEILKEKFRYCQSRQESAKRDLLMYDPYDYEDEDVSKEEHERRYYAEIEANKYTLRHLEYDIKELRKIVKNLNRKQNEERLGRSSNV